MHERSKFRTAQTKAVKVCSVFLQDHLWVVIDGSFEPKDSLAICYPEELSEWEARHRTATGDSQTKLALQATESSKKGLRVDEGYEQLLSRNFGRNHQPHSSGNKSQLVRFSQQVSPDNPFSHKTRGGKRRARRINHSLADP